MAKSKQQKRAEALDRLNARLEAQKAAGECPSPAQMTEFRALNFVKYGRPKTELEKLFGVAGDPVTGVIHANPLPWDFRPTRELENIVTILTGSNKKFVEFNVSLDRSDGYPYATYEGNGSYMEQWVARHTAYRFHHSKNLYGGRVVVVFCLEGQVPCYNDRDELISGTTKEMYDRHYY